MQRMHIALAAGPVLALCSFLTLSVALTADSAVSSSTQSRVASDAVFIGGGSPSALTAGRAAGGAFPVLTPVPEPSTALLLGLGLGALALRRERRGTTPRGRTLAALAAALLFGATPAAALDPQVQEACAFWVSSDAEAQKTMIQRYARQLEQQDGNLASCVYLQWDRFTGALDRACFDGSDLNQALAQAYLDLAASELCD